MNAASAAQDVDSRLWIWGTQDEKPRFLHTMIRVRDLDASLKFYEQGLGLKPLHERFDVPARRVTAVFIGLAGFAEGGAIELVHPWDQNEPFTHGTGAGHFSFGVPDIEAQVEKLKALGAEFTLAPTALIEGGPRVAFFKDPDGYSIELIQTRR